MGAIPILLNPNITKHDPLIQRLVHHEFCDILSRAAKKCLTIRSVLDPINEVMVQPMGINPKARSDIVNIFYQWICTNVELKPEDPLFIELGDSLIRIRSWALLLKIMPQYGVPKSTFFTDFIASSLALCRYFAK